MFMEDFQNGLKVGYFYGSICLQVLSRWSMIEKVMDKKDVRQLSSCVVIMMTTLKIKWYQVKSVYVEDNSSGRKGSRRLNK